MKWWQINDINTFSRNPYAENSERSWEEAMDIYAYNNKNEVHPELIEFLATCDINTPTTVREDKFNALFALNSKHIQKNPVEWIEFLQTIKALSIEPKFKDAEHIKPNRESVFKKCLPWERSVEGYCEISYTKHEADFFVTVHGIDDDEIYFNTQDCDLADKVYSGLLQEPVCSRYKTEEIIQVISDIHSLKDSFGGVNTVKLNNLNLYK